MAKKSKTKSNSGDDFPVEVEAFPIHRNNLQTEDAPPAGKPNLPSPTDAFCTARLNGYYSDSAGNSGYEIVAKRWTRKGMQWERGRKWETVGYLHPSSSTYQPIWLCRSAWLNSLVESLIADIREYETIMKARLGLPQNLQQTQQTSQE